MIWCDLTAIDCQASNCSGGAGFTLKVTGTWLWKDLKDQKKKKNWNRIFFCSPAITLLPIPLYAFKRLQEQKTRSNMWNFSSLRSCVNWGNLHARTPRIAKEYPVTTGNHCLLCTQRNQIEQGSNTRKVTSFPKRTQKQKNWPCISSPPKQDFYHYNYEPTKGWLQ